MEVRQRVREQGAAGGERRFTTIGSREVCLRVGIVGQIIISYLVTISCGKVCF